MAEDLDDALLTLDQEPTSSDAEKLAHEAMYALAVLWKSPPVATPDIVRGWLIDLGYEELIEPFLADLEPPA